MYRHGYIVSVIDIIEIGQGQILPSRGETLFSVKYIALVFRPMKNEVVDAIVSTVTEVCIDIQTGILCLLDFPTR